MLELDPAEVIELLLACVLHVTKGVEESKRGLDTELVLEGAEGGGGGLGDLGRREGGGGGGEGGGDDKLHS